MPSDTPHGSNTNNNLGVVGSVCIYEIIESHNAFAPQKRRTTHTHVRRDETKMVGKG